MKNFFISYSRYDENWAKWIAFALESAGYSTVIQARDIVVGSHFVLEMHKATIGCEKVIAVLSPDYLASMFASIEWAAALSSDPTGEKRMLIPIRVRSCEPPGLLKALVYCDLVGLEEGNAKQTLINSVRQILIKPDSVPFPEKNENNQGQSSSISKEGVVKDFPGPKKTVRLNRKKDIIKEASNLLNILRTTGVTFDAQASVRSRLHWFVCERLVLYPIPPFEEMLNEYYAEFNNYERQLFQTIRSYTENTLYEYNTNALNIIRNHHQLKSVILHLTDLETHLTVWLSKYKGVFLQNQLMSTVYVGVDEQVPFPKVVVSELWDYLSKQKGLKNLLILEPKPVEWEESGSGPNSNWWIDVKNKWNIKRLNELEAEERLLISRNTYNGLTKEQRQSLLKLDSEYANLLYDMNRFTNNFELIDSERIWNALRFLFIDELKDLGNIEYKQFKQDPGLRFEINQRLSDSKNKQMPIELSGNLLKIYRSLFLSRPDLNEILQLLPALAYYSADFPIAEEMFNAWMVTKNNFMAKVRV